MKACGKKSEKRIPGEKRERKKKKIKEVVEYGGKYRFNFRPMRYQQLAGG